MDTFQACQPAPAWTLLALFGFVPEQSLINFPSERPVAAALLGSRSLCPACPGAARLRACPPVSSRRAGLKPGLNTGLPAGSSSPRSSSG